MNIIFIILIFIIITDILLSIIRNIRRKNTYLKAEKISKIKNKKLLVIGSPDNGFWNKHICKAYGYGDVCLDLMGCNCSSQIKGDLFENLKKMKNNEYVIFESCVLEYIDSKLLKDIYKEIYRVSNGDYYGVRIFPNIFTTNIDLIKYG